jgi:hypothetical protein
MPRGASLTWRWRTPTTAPTSGRRRRTGRPFRRRSAAYFHDGNADAVISTIPGCERRDADPYPPITVAGHIAAKLAGSRTLRLNSGAEREARRLRS